MSRKPTATNNLLTWESHHQLPLKKWILRSLYLQIKRNCSDLKAFSHQAKGLRNRFLERRYPLKLENEVHKSALKWNGTDLLTPKVRTEQRQMMCLIGTFDSQTNRVKRIWRRYWDILRADPDLCDIIPENPAIIFRRERSLRERLVHSNYEPSVLGLIEKSWALLDVAHVGHVNLLKRQRSLQV